MNTANPSPLELITQLNPMVFYARFPHISEKIFEKLNINSLKKCREVSKSWEECIDNENILWKRIVSELHIIGINSLPIVALMSSFMGGVIALQTASNMTTPLLPDYTVGYINEYV